MKAFFRLSAASSASLRSTSARSTCTESVTSTKVTMVWPSGSGTVA